MKHKQFLHRRWPVLGIALGSLVLGVLLLAGVARASSTGGGGPFISRTVIGGGGGHAAAAPFTLDATVGQAVVGIVTNGSERLCAGFWCGLGGQPVYLPVAMRGS